MVVMLNNLVENRVVSARIGEQRGYRVVLLIMCYYICQIEVVHTLPSKCDFINEKFNADSSTLKTFERDQKTNKTQMHGNVCHVASAGYINIKTPISDL